MRVPKHLVEKRREQLRGLIRTDGFLPLAEICRRLKVSPATARRDLVEIAAAGHITRTHGGALADYNASFASHLQRQHRARTAKERIAAKAVAEIPDSGTLFLDAGTTVQAIARRLLKRRDNGVLRVVTNSLAVAAILGGAPQLQVEVLGGTFLHRQAILLGEATVRALAPWRFDISFLGGEGLDSEGITNSHPELAAFQREVLARSKRTLFCLDATKLGRATPHRVVDWTAPVEIATDATARALSDAGVPRAPI
ncbi:DeoR/GlpR family DNA-binding transcription regulator [Nibricoccus sp. IMCC34717]|uniref:DeoR/GlpR family DNA-binding transcription regulator n=1 Tax=Nibricoccus sp. IMCC34717 TaxID=3034021 RepID=UPI00384FAF29